MPVPQPAPLLPLQIPDPAPVSLDPVNWQVVTAESAASQLEQTQQRGFSAVLFALDEQGFENLAVNFSKLRSYIMQQQAVIAAYREYQQAQQAQQAQQENQPSASDAKQPRRNRWLPWF